MLGCWERAAIYGWRSGGWAVVTVGIEGPSRTLKTGHAVRERNSQLTRIRVSAHAIPDGDPLEDDSGSSSHYIIDPGVIHRPGGESDQPEIDETVVKEINIP